MVVEQRLKKKYHSSKLEFVALKLTICEHFNYLFYSPHFELYTDFNPLTHIKTSCKVNAIAQGWWNKLASFNFSIHYKPRVQNHVAETFSRFSIHKDNCISDAGEIKSILDTAVNQQDNNESWIPTINTLSTSYDDIPLKYYIKEVMLLYGHLIEKN